MGNTRVLVVALLAGSQSLACSGDWKGPDVMPQGEAGAGSGGDDCPGAFNPRNTVPVEARRGFRVVENRIEDSEGEPVVLRGVNRSGSEYQCSKGLGFFDGEANEEAVRAMASWNINAVRVPLNEACWLGISGAAEKYSGDNYKTAIRTFVSFLKRYGLIPILDLHWAAPGEILPDDLFPMPNADHSVQFWTDVAETFADDAGVIFEPYNEPFPNGNADDLLAWQCWRDGCEESLYWGSSETYQAVGMQALVDAIRDTGSDHLILLGGTQFSNALTRWLEFKPDDPLDNLAPAWHVYNFNQCADETCWNGAPLEIVESYPLVVTELGQRDCAGDFVSPLLQWLDRRDAGYLAWSWNAFGACVPHVDWENVGAPWSLVTDYFCPMPNGGFAEAYYQHLQSSAP